MKNKILFIVSLLFGLIFINAGLNKFLNYMPVPDDMPAEFTKLFGAFMTIGWLLPLVGFAEILGGLLFIIPRTRALGAVVIFPVMIGIIFTNAAVPSSLPLPLALFAINLWVIFENRHKYAPMFAK